MKQSNLLSAVLADHLLLFQLQNSYVEAHLSGGPSHIDDSSDDNEGPSEADVGDDDSGHESGQGSSDGDNPTDEFGEELAFLLSDDPPLPEHPTLSAINLLHLATENPAGVREWLGMVAEGNAGDCACETPLPKWDKNNPKKTTTCGRQQASLVAQLNLQGVLERQKERDSKGDNVGYVLARTVRSNLQHEAAYCIGCRGAGNQCVRGPCFASALAMFCGKGMEGIPREVVLALLRH